MAVALLPRDGTQEFGGISCGSTTVPVHRKHTNYGFIMYT